MTRLQPAGLGIGCLCAIALGCAGGATRHESVTTPDVSTALIERQARILRAEDRREVDDGLLALLGDDDPRIRALAVQALGRIGDPSAADRITELFEDEDPRVRERAVFALGLLGVGGAVVEPPLALLSDPDPSVRGAVAEALGMIGDEKTADRLLTLLTDPEPEVVARACYSVPRFSQPGFAVDRLIEAGSSDQPAALFACTWALSDLAAQSERLDLRTRERARQRMLELSRSSQSWVRRLAAEGLFIPTREEEAATVGRLIDDPDPAVRIAAVGAITFPGAPLEPFISKALGDKDDRVFLAVIQGLGRMRGDEIAEALARIVVHGERQWVREQAVVALGRASNLAAQMANGLSRAEEVGIRRATAQVLLGRVDDETVEYARRLYADSDPSVRAAVIPSFAEIDEPLSESLADSLDSDDPTIRVAVARAAGRRLARSDLDQAAIDDALAVLRRVWTRANENSDLESSIAVLSAISRLGPNESARAILDQAATFPDWYVRKLAAAQLERVYGTQTSILPAADFPIDHYIEIARWASTPHAAIVTVQRPGFVPGRFTVRLDVAGTPLSAWNFARLAGSGRYDDQPLDEVLPDLATYFAEPAASEGPDRTLRDEVRATWFFPGTVGFSSPGRDGSSGGWFVTQTPQPAWMTRYTAFGQVVQNFPGVVARLLPGDRVVSVAIYEGDGTEPLPPAEP